MIDLHWPSMLVGVLATLAIVTAWLNRPSAEPDRAAERARRRARCARRTATPSTPQPVGVRWVEAGLDTWAEAVPIPGEWDHLGVWPDPSDGLLWAARPPYDGDQDGWA